MRYEALVLDSRTEWCPDPDYVRDLIAETGLSRQGVADRLGVSRRTVFKWLSGETPIPYVAQFTIESLVFLVTHTRS